jgi:hydrogenase nickel incorporation protein HypA/HybF
VARECDEVPQSEPVVTASLQARLGSGFDRLANAPLNLSLLCRGRHQIIFRENEVAALHELSIVYGIIETVSESAQAANAKRITAIHLRVGALSGVVKDALLFSFDLAAQDTLLEGSKLIVEELPLVIFCKPCDKAVELSGVQSFRCPVCHTPSADIRQGKELEVRSIEIEV